MPEITEGTKFMFRHALGLNSRDANGKSYRNRYTVGPGTTRHHEWLELVKQGLAEMYPIAKDDHFITFCLTRVGAEAALQKGESLCPEDFPPEAK